MSSVILLIIKLEKENNLAFIDGQNLHLGTKEEGWKIDLVKFRVYLKEKYELINI